MWISFKIVIWQKGHLQCNVSFLVLGADGSFALVSSALTGPIWDGSLWVFKSFAEFQACPNVFLTNTRVNAGMSDAIWLDQTRLLVALDTGELEVWSSMPLGGGLELKGSLKSHDDMALCLCHHGDRESGHVVSGGADGRCVYFAYDYNLNDVYL